MKRLKVATVGLCTLTLVGVGCSTKTGTGALIGTGSGTAVGAIIGAIAGNTAVGAAIGAAVGAGTGALIGKHMDKVAAETAAQVKNAKVEEVTDANGLKAVKVTFDNGILFNVGKYALQANAKNELSKFSSVLKNNADCQVDIQGYASSDGSAEVNQVLSDNRANAVKAYLVNTCGVPGSQIKSTKGYGTTNLVTNADGSENVKASRRVEVYLYASKDMIEKANAGKLD